MRTNGKPFTPGLESQKIEEALDLLLPNKGDFATYEEIIEITGFHPMDFNGPCNTARTHIRRKRSVVIEPAVNSDGVRGMKALTDAEIIRQNGKRIKSLAKRNKQDGEKLECVEFDELDRDRQIEHQTTYTQRQTMRLLLAEKARVKIVKAIESGDRKALPIGKTLELFGG